MYVSKDTRRFRNKSKILMTAKGWELLPTFQSVDTIVLPCYPMKLSCSGVGGLPNVGSMEDAIGIKHCALPLLSSVCRSRIFLGRNENRLVGAEEDPTINEMVLQL